CLISALPPGLNGTALVLATRVPPLPPQTRLAATIVTGPVVPARFPAARSSPFTSRGSIPLSPRDALTPRPTHWTPPDSAPPTDAPGIEPTTSDLNRGSASFLPSA